MSRFFYVAIGGSTGALLRYLVSGWVYRFIPAMFPWGTLVVNLTGSLIIGLLWGMLEFGAISQNVRLFVFIGILGSFTTFATFSLESFNLLRDGEYALLFWNVTLSVFLGIGLVIAGYFSSRYFISFLR
jgi:fluoride exporter